MFEINGLWTGKAGDANPKKSIEVPASTSRFFYRFERIQDITEVVKSVVRVNVNGTEILKELADFKPGDKIDTGFFDVPASMRTGEVKVSIGVYSYEDTPENARKLFSTDEPFTITFE